MHIPSALEPLLLQFSFAFTNPTFARFSVLMLSAILTTGRRTISNLLRTTPALTNGHASSFHRVFSCRRWALWKLGYALAYCILHYLVPEGPVHVAVDDTVDEHRGKKVYGKACHRDAVRSTHSYTAYRWGHKWVVLAILVQLPFASRPWALPVLVALYHSPEWNKKHNRRHKTPPELARQLLAVLLHWFPERKFIAAGDGGFSTHALAAFAQRQGARLALVGRFYPQANLYAPPPPRQRTSGRPRLKGAKLPSPSQVVQRAHRTRLTVAWYGGGTRRVAIVSGTGYWYKGGQGLVAVRWIFVHDLTGTHRDEYFFSTDTSLSAKEIIETFTGRWSIEVTFQEMRAYLGLETTRGRKRETVLRLAPCLFGLYSVVVLIYHWLPEQARTAGVTWAGKETVTFSDALLVVLAGTAPYHYQDMPSHPDAACPSDGDTLARWDELLRVTRSWRLDSDFGELLGRVARQTAQLLDLDRAVVFLADRHTGLAHRAVFPTLGQTATRELLRCSRPIAAKVFEDGRPLFAHGHAGTGQLPQRCVLCVPLTASRGILGALYADTSNTHRQPTRQCQEFLEMLALQAATALEHAQLYHSAITDPLTGLFSHRHFQQEVEQSVRRASRSAQPFSLLIMDLDHFKQLNDTCGHEEGNRCLLEVVSILRGSLRAADILARFGGDEFEMLLPDTPAQGALRAAEKIRQKIGALRFPKGLRVTATVGIASYPDNGLDAQALFLNADAALYQAKEAGRNRSVVSAVSAGAAGTAKAAAHAPEAPSLESTVETEPRASILSPAVSSALVREQVDGHVVIKRLGTGSTGEVLLVRQPDLQREVALKRPLTAHLTPAQNAAFEREARVTASLNYPGVVPVHTMGRDADGRRYYTMKPLSGHTLAEILAQRNAGGSEAFQSFSMNRLVEILYRASETIAYAHQRQVMHLDLTPSNIVVGNSGEVTVIDWARGASFSGNRRVAFQIMRGTAPRGLKVLLGSPAYAAPEHLNARAHIGAASDVYALGAILYEILTGKPPRSPERSAGALAELARGSLLPPEEAAPQAGIDPALAGICTATLRRDPRRRLTALQFCRRLGHYVRREADWMTTRFGQKQHPLRAGEWRTAVGRWELHKGEWVSANNSANVLLWKIHAPGAFRFMCEGWSETGAELSLIGRLPIAGDAEFQPYYGYLFQLGAEGNICTKLARNYIDVLTIPGAALERGRRYLLELSYQEGWAYCFLDGKCIFSYRELFPFSGSQLGLCSWGAGAHFRPVEVHRQSWGLQIPLIRMADALLERSQYASAAERYRELARHLPNRMDGLEARLKLGVCLAQLDQPQRARRILRSLAGTALEPFAMAQEALLCYRRFKRHENRNGLQLFRSLRRRFPDSQASTAIFDALQRAFATRGHIPAPAHLQRIADLRQLAASTCDPPGQTQISNQVARAGCLCRMGHWRLALEEMIDFKKKLLPAQYATWSFAPTLAALALANGRWDLLPESPFTMTQWQINDDDILGAVVMRCAIHRGLASSFLGRCTVEKGQPGILKLLSSKIQVLEVLLSQRRHAVAVKLIRQQILPALRQDPAHYYEVGRVLCEAQQAELLDEVMELYERQTNAGKQPHNIGSLLRGRCACERGDFDGAARHLANWTPQPGYLSYSYGLVLQELLASLGYLPSSLRGALAKWRRNYLAGPLLRLSRMFAGRIPPRPDDTWPHPLFHPEWRLWLALWLEARGRAHAARQVASPACEARFGLAHSQPAIRLLLLRCSS